MLHRVLERRLLLHCTGGLGTLVCNQRSWIATNTQLCGIIMLSTRLCSNARLVCSMLSTSWQQYHTLRYSTVELNTMKMDPAGNSKLTPVPCARTAFVQLMGAAAEEGTLPSHSKVPHPRCQLSSTAATAQCSNFSACTQTHTAVVRQS